ncbi:MAG: MaoC/PaaZ C-terminal domain-containing protein [Chloroflexi bacterium]|nr:MaoC/PaaZ C-terminal domain-containing protein [Chloroflexota bacterium]
MRLAEATPGLELPELRIELTHELLAAYAGATWDFHRYHYDADFARATTGARDVFADGQMLGALLARQLMAWSAPEGWVRRLALRYRSMSFPGETLVCRGRVTQVRVENGSGLIECELSVATNDGREVVAPASATVELPA